MLRAEIVPPTKKILEETLAKIEKFGDPLTDEDKAIFNDLIEHCKQHMTKATKVQYTYEEFPLMIAMLFSQYRRVTALEKQAIVEDTDNQIPPQATPRPYGLYQKQIALDAILKGS